MRVKVDVKDIVMIFDNKNIYDIFYKEIMFAEIYN